MLYKDSDAGIVIFSCIRNLPCLCSEVKFLLIHGLCNEHYAPLVFTLREHLP